MERKESGRVKVDGAYVKFLSNRGRLQDNMKKFPDACEA